MSTLTEMMFLILLIDVAFVTLEADIIGGILVCPLPPVLVLFAGVVLIIVNDITFIITFTNTIITVDISNGIAYRPSPGIGYDSPIAEAKVHM
jgi:hypothetical protein